MKNIYLLKDLAKISGYSTYTLKYYLRFGLLREIGRSPATNFRYFDDSSFERLKEIRRLQKDDCSLKEIYERLEKRNGKEKVNSRQVLLTAIFALVMLTGICDRVAAQTEILNAVVEEPASEGPTALAAGLHRTLEVLDVKDMDIREVLDLISLDSGFTIFAETGVEGRVTIYLADVDVFDALRIILDANNLAYSHQGDGVIRVMTAQAFESAFGYPFSQKIQTKIVPLRFAEASGIETLLNQMKSPTGKVMYNDESRALILLDAPAQLQSMTALIQELDVPVETKTFELKYILAKAIAKDVQESLTKNVGRVSFDGQPNHIIVTDTPEKILGIEELIRKTDQPAVEISIEAKILQIVLNDEHRDGIDWEAIVSDFHALAFEGFTEGRAGPLGLGTVTEEDYLVLLDALDTVGGIHTVSNIKIMRTDAQDGEIVIRASDLLSAREKEERPSEARKERMIRYHFRPVLAEGTDLALKFWPAVGENFDESQGISFPIPQGTTVVVGGLFEEVMVEAIRKIPLLGDLPFLGFAFRNQAQRLRKTEVIVFLTPKVIVKEQ